MDNDYLLLEDDTELLLEDNTPFLLEQQTPDSDGTGILPGFASFMNTY